ncbi:MAG: baseplate J/gp47 family protein [Syntrophomonadaceae bacterium]|nr:baseplate J/gp47 family protein [Syntrophomonadaceae bacterium]
MGNTITEVRARMLATIPSGLDQSEGSFIYDILAAAAIEMATAYAEANTVLAKGFAETTAGIYLDYRAHEHGLTRNAATAAAGQVTITGTAGVVVPTGSLFATNGGIQFKTTSEATIGGGGTITAAIEAVVAGISGNVPSSTIILIPVSITGVTAVTNASGTTGGTDEETDAALLERLLEAVQSPTTSGNSAHYKQWAKSVDGVGDAKILPLWDGNGTVKVVAIDSNKAPVSSAIVDNVSAYIETVRPIGATVTVASATGLSINVSATLTLESGYTAEGVLSDVEGAITSYLQSIAFKQDYVSYARIGSILLDTEGILDYASLTVNSGTANVSVASTEVAILGTVTLS